MTLTLRRPSSIRKQPSPASPARNNVWSAARAMFRPLAKRPRCNSSGRLVSRLLVRGEGLFMWHLGRSAQGWNPGCSISTIRQAPNVEMSRGNARWNCPLEPSDELDLMLKLRDIVGRPQDQGPNLPAWLEHIM